MRFLLEYAKKLKVTNLNGTRRGGDRVEEYDPNDRDFESKLATIIDDGLENYSQQDANKIIQAYCEKKFASSWKTIGELYQFIKANLEEYGVSKNNSNFWKFVTNENIANRLKNVVFTPAQAKVLYNCLSTSTTADDYVNADEAFLYQPETYRSDKSLQGCIFVNIQNNINRYGLIKKDGNPVSVADVQATKSDRELQTLLNSNQTRTPDEDVGNVYSMLEKDSTIPSGTTIITLKSTDADKINFIKKYLEDYPDAVKVWTQIINAHERGLEKSVIDTDDIVETDDGGIDYKKTLANHIISLKSKVGDSSEEDSYSKTSPVINLLVNDDTAKSKFENTIATKNLDIDELVAYVEELFKNSEQDTIRKAMENFKVAINGDESKGITANKALASDYKTTLRKLFAKKIPAGSGVDEVDQYIINQVYKYIQKNLE